MQISEDLVQYITRELMKRLGLASVEPAAPTAPAKLLHLVGPKEALSPTALAGLEKNFNVYEHKSWDEDLPPEASVLITSLSIQALTRVAEGDEGCTVEGRVLLAALLNGQPVAATKSGLLWRRYHNTGPKGLLAKYVHYENVLQTYGLKLVDEENIVESLLGPVKAAPKAIGFSLGQSWPEPVKSFTKAAGRRKVFSENDLMTACPVAGGLGQTLHLGPADLLTPLAQDYAKAMQINIITG